MERAEFQQESSYNYCPHKSNTSSCDLHSLYRKSRFIMRSFIQIFTILTLCSSLIEAESGSIRKNAVAETQDRENSRLLHAHTAYGSKSGGMGGYKSGGMGGSNGGYGGSTGGYGGSTGGYGGSTGGMSKGLSKGGMSKGGLSKGGMSKGGMSKGGMSKGGMSKGGMSKGGSYGGNGGSNGGYGQSGGSTSGGGYRA
jgi:hypothetical protein